MSFLSLVSGSATAQYLTTTASNNSVGANVWNSSGYIDFFTPGSPPNRLSFAEHSFLTVEVNGKFYTNNQYLSDSEKNPVYVPDNLNNVTSNKLYKAKDGSTNDTIRTTWTISNSFQIIQDVYPVVFPLSGAGQIVYKISINNLQDAGLTAQAQFLLDNEISTNSPPLANDNDTLASRYGYSTTWQTFSNSTPPGIPPFELAFERGLCSSALFPGLIGVGFTNDSLAPEPMGLIPPETYTFVDWAEIAQYYTWGFPSSYIGQHYTDAATLIQWPASGASPNSENEIARGSFGVQQCGTCFGNIAGLIFHPEHIVWTLNGYVPEHFPVEAIIFDPNSSSTFQNATGTQITQGPVKIYSPQPTTNNDQSQQQSIQPASIQTCSLGDVMWYDWADSSLINCSSDSVYNIEVQVNGGGISKPFFLMPCVCPIEVDCQEKDVVAPRFTLTKTGITGGFDTASFGVHDDSSTDLGIKTITYTIDPPGPPACIKVTLDPFSPCDNSGVVHFFAKQVDSTCSGCVYIVATDCAGNVSYDTICFPAHTVPGHPDEPPVWVLRQRYHWNDSNSVQLDTLVPCNAHTSVWNVTDSIIGDAGMDSIKIISKNNMTLTVPPFVNGAKFIDSIVVSVIDTDQDGSIILEAIDDSDHVAYDTINYCTVSDTHSPFLQSGSPIPGVSWTVTVWDDSATLWDRGVDSVLLTNVINCKPVVILPQYPITIDSVGNGTYIVKSIPSCSQFFQFNMDIIDSFSEACWTGQVWDCAGDTNTSNTTCENPDMDTFCPQYKIDTLANPPGIHVVVYDIHLDANGDTIHYDLGVKSVTFCGNAEHDVTLSYGGNNFQTVGDSLPGIYESSIGKVGANAKYPDSVSFDIFVTDTSLQGLNSACVCFNAVDGAGNGLCSPSIEPFNWCYSLAHDTNPPKVTAVPAGCLSLDVIVTDSLLNDEGIHRVWIDSNIGANFNPFDTTLATHPNTFGLTLTKIRDSISSYARVSAIDLYGSQGTPADRISHTDSTDVWMYSQNLSMSANAIDSIAGNDTFAVYLIPTDSIPLSQKRITAYQFQFHLTGSDSVSFVGTTTAGTESGNLLNWTVTPVLAGPSPNRYYTINGFGGAGSPVLPDSAISTTLPLLKLIFKGVPDSIQVQVTDIVVDTDQCLASVIYNNGNDTSVSGPNYSVTLPAPNGRINGGRIILTGFCTPIIQGGSGQPSIISLAPTMPNPTASSALIVYTIPADAQVSLDLYNALGEKVRTLVSEFQKQGDYRLQLDRNGLPEGSYFLRLASGGQVVSRQVTLTH